MSNQKYHSVYAPVPSVLEYLGGSCIESHATRGKNLYVDKKKNLLVIPQQAIFELTQHEKKSRSASRALDAIREVYASVNHARRLGHTLVSDIVPGLDIVFEHVDSTKMGQSYKVVPYVRKANDLAKKISQRSAQAITFDKLDSILLSQEGLSYETPRSVYVDASLLYSSRFSGNDQLFDALLSFQGELSSELAQEHMDETIKPNDIFFFDDGSYAIAEPILERKSNSREVVGLSGLTVKLYTEKNQLPLKHRGLPIDACMGVKPLNTEQRILTHFALNPDIKLLILTAEAGCGKTTILYNTALELVSAGLEGMSTSKQKKQMLPYSSMVISKPHVSGSSEEDIGFLPGDLFAKIEPHVASFIDAHKLNDLHTGRGGERLSFQDIWSPEISGKAQGAQAKTNKIHGLFPHVEFEILLGKYARGRSLNRSVVIIDEFQNLPIEEGETILTRVSDTTKLFLTGDPAQVDNKDPQVNYVNNALVAAIKEFRLSNWSDLWSVAHVHLKENQRGSIAAHAIGMSKRQ
jgi:predicted ribonuclease YlaK